MNTADIRIRNAHMLEMHELEAAHPAALIYNVDVWEVFNLTPAPQDIVR